MKWKESRERFKRSHPGFSADFCLWKQTFRNAASAGRCQILLKMGNQSISAQEPADPSNMDAEKNRTKAQGKSQKRSGG